MENAESKSETLEVISFRIDGQEYCLDIMAVREIRGWTVATSLPHSPSYVRGVINLRGAVLAILDLRARLGLGVAEPNARSVIIVVHIGNRLVGLLVDEVSEILAAERSAIQPTPNVGCETVNRFVRGIIAMEGRMISWLAIEDILPEQTDAEAA
jgi:purine-binding chemotaxis protein CheW